MEGLTSRSDSSTWVLGMPDAFAVKVGRASSFKERLEVVF